MATATPGRVLRTQFRRWATATLNEFLLKGFVLDDQRLKAAEKTFGKDYFDELLERIRDSERRFYQEITDIYATASDYNKDADVSRTFFAMVQNKLEWAITGMTAAELIKDRADASQPKELSETKARLAKPEAQMEKLTSQNSSIPPSTQHPHARPELPAKKRQSKPRKQQGAQLGHARKTRPLVPIEQCDEVLTLKPTQCRGCQETLTGTDAEPLRHQVIDIPVPQPIVTEYQLHRLTCRCGKQTCATLPLGVPSGQCGPRLAAFAGLLMVHFRQSKRRTANFLSDILNVPCSTGWTVKMQNIASQAVAAPYEELRQQLTHQRQLYVDESPTKEQNQKAWLWVAVAPMFAVFGIFLNRKRDSLKALVGDYSNTILNCDRAKMYLDATTLQWCWAHLKRDIQKLIDSSDAQVRRLGHDLMREQRKIFLLWHEYRDKKISWTKFKRDAVPICEEFDAYVLRGAFSGNPKLKGMCDGIYENRDWLWTFTKVKDVEPTNNTAERALRGAGIYRKPSFGTQSPSGSRFVERMLTITETCRLQKRSVLDSGDSGQFSQPATTVANAATRNSINKSRLKTRRPVNGYTFLARLFLLWCMSRPSEVCAN